MHYGVPSQHFRRSWTRLSVNPVSKSLMASIGYREILRQHRGGFTTHDEPKSTRNRTPAVAHDHTNNLACSRWIIFPVKFIPSHYLPPTTTTSASLPRLLRRHLGLHPPPRRQDHLVPPALQRSLALVPVRAPALALSILLARRRGVQLALQIVPRDKVGLRRLLRLSGRRRRAGAAGGLAGRRRRLEGDRRLEGQFLLEEEKKRPAWELKSSTYRV